VSRRAAVVLLLLGLPVATPAADLPTAQRLELLERRVNRITELTLQLDELRRENRELRGEIESLGHQVRQLERKQRDIYLDIDQRLSGGVPAATAAPNAAPTASPAAAGQGEAPRPPAAVVDRATTPPQATADRSQVQAEYQAAYELLSPQQKRYKEAAVAFAAFVDKYPQDELTPNAQYWLGEAHYVSQNNAAAMQAFEQVVARFPDSTKAPGALYKIGRLHEAAGQKGEARTSYRKVLDDYPNSPAAGLARRQLDKLGR